MIDPLVRPATLDDIDQLRHLGDEARTALLDQRGGQRWLETNPSRRDSWAESIDAGDVHVAHIDEVIVGYLVAPRHDAMVRIDEVYVIDAARELGFGDALLAAALDAGRRDGCTLVEGEALPGDRNTKNLYERAGITARLITVSRRLV